MTLPQLSLYSNFVDYVQQHPEQNFELIQGEILAVMPSYPRTSEIAMNIVIALGIFLRGKQLGRITGEQGGYVMDAENIFAPDVAFISAQRQSALPNDAFNPIPPDFAVEVISPADLNDPKARIERKIKVYQAIKLPLLWVIYPQTQTVQVYENGILTHTATLSDTLTGGTVLPNFTLPVQQIFS